MTPRRRSGRAARGRAASCRLPVLRSARRTAHRRRGPGEAPVALLRAERLGSRRRRPAPAGTGALATRNALRTSLCPDRYAESPREESALSTGGLEVQVPVRREALAN